MSGWLESATPPPPYRTRGRVATGTQGQYPGVTLALFWSPAESGVGWVLRSIPRILFLTVDGVGVAQSAPSGAAAADASPERETSVVDDGKESSRRSRREERRARPRRSAGLGVERLNIVTSDRVASDRATTATTSRYSRPWPDRAPREPGGARLELRPAGFRVESGIAPPPPKHREGIPHRAQGPGGRYREFRCCACGPGHPL